MAKSRIPKSKDSKEQELKKLTPKDVALPKGFSAKTKTKFSKIKDSEVNFAKFLEVEEREFRRLKLIELGATKKYVPTPTPGMTACGNGDFEKELNIIQWQGAYGSVPNSPSTFTEGISGGPISSGNSHQTWVGPGTDPNVGIPTTAPGSAGALRIGNSMNGYGSELLSKTFVVSPSESTISFWYAVVMQNPIGHGVSKQPLFWVRVTDAGGAIVPGAFDFGQGSDKLIADTNNPFFKSTSKGNETIVYRDWGCAQIDLTSQIGKKVTIEFVSGDCGYGGHWGYAYIDRYCDTCDGSPTGTLDYDCENSDDCGEGELCFNYSLPTTTDSKGNPVTGTIDIELDIYQNGSLVTSIKSPTLGTGSSHCFSIDPATISGLNLSLGGFDFVATGYFSISSFSLGKKKIGIAPSGTLPGQNNDYDIACKSCADHRKEQESDLLSKCGTKANKVESYNCKCPDSKDKTACGCTKGITKKEECKKAKLPKLEPCITLSWGDSPCDCFETTDYEVACITVCNCYTNVAFENFTINKIVITDENGKPVATLPNGKPSIEIVPSGPICFGDIPPCTKGKPSCKSREISINTVGARSGKYRLKLMGVCYDIRYGNQREYCFDLKLCED